MSIAPGPHLYDDPIARTRMAWVRTILAAIVLGFLLVRGVVVLGAPLPLAYLAGVVTAILVATAFSRFLVLARHEPNRVPNVTRRLVVGGILTLVGIGVAVTLLATSLE
jgi:cytochrome c biogenesis protein CcdA